MTAVFLQVRLDSTRLPRKALADLGGSTVTQRCIEALAAVRVDRRVLVTEPESAGELEPLARSAGWEIYIGNKQNVLDRFVQASRSIGTSTVVRATGDNPLVSARLANELLELHLASGADYSGFVGSPIGTGVEVLKVSALEEAWSSDPDEYEQEHASPFLYRRPERFHINHPAVAEALRAPAARVTLDTPDDLQYLRSLWTDLYRGKPLEVEDLIPWLNRHPR